MASKLKQLEKQYMACMMVVMDKSSRFSVLDSDISTKGFGQMYFMLKANPTKEEWDDQGSFRSPGGSPFLEQDESPKDLLDVLQNNSRVIISGEPGAGKTTSLVYLTVLLTANYAMKTRISIEKAEPEPVMTILDKFPFSDLYIPVFIKLSGIKEQHLANINRFNDLIVQQVGQLFSIEDSKDLVDFWIKENRLWVILDGLDEMPGKARDDLLDKLRFYLKVNNEKNRMTMSSRPTGTPYERIMQKEKEGDSTNLLLQFSLCPLDGDAASKEFSSAWLQKLGEPEFEKQAEKLIEGIYKKGTINLARNPMLLRMMIHVYQANGCNAEQLPPSRVHLYDKFFHDVLLGKDELQKFQIRIKRNAKRFEQLMHILEHIAWFVHREDKALHKDDLIEELESYFPEGFAEEDWFNIFSTKMRLLYHNASGEYEFTHRSYQECFVARRLLALYKVNICGKQWVMNRVFDLCAYSDDYREVVLMFLKELSLDIDEKKRYREIKNLYEKNLKYSVVKIGDLFNERILDPETALTVEKNNSVKIEAISSLGRAKDHSSVEPLITALQDEDGDVRRNAAEALGKIGDSRAVPALLSVLEGDDSDVRINLAVALGKIGDDRAVESLITALRDEDVIIRLIAAVALGEIGDDRAVESLITALRDEDEFVRGNAAEALRKIGDDRVVDGLLTTMRDEDGGVRENAAKALGELGGDRAVESLITALRDENVFVRRYSAEALGKIGGDCAVEALVTALQDEDIFVRRYSAEGLGKIGDDRVVAALITALRDKYGIIREYAARALGEIGDDNAVESLITALADEDGLVRKYVAEALGKIGDDRAVEPLITAMRDEDGGVRINAAEALGEIGGNCVLEFLITALQDENGFVRANAAWVLGKIGDDRVMEALISALRDENGGVRRYAAEALGELGGNHAVESLIAAMRDADGFVRRYAARALGEIGDDRAVESLNTALRDEDVYVRRYVVEALGEIGGDHVVKALITALRDKDEAVRVEAVWALEREGIAPAMIEDMENNPKNKKLQKKANNISSMKNSLPILPDPKVPGTDVINFIRKNSKGYFGRLVKAGVVSGFVFSVWLLGKSITKDNLDQAIPGFVKLVDDHPLRTMAILGLLYFVIESWRRFEKSKKSAK